MQLPFSVYLQTTFEVFGPFASCSEPTGILLVSNEAFSILSLSY
jgi:hypothetical protein